MEGVSMGSVLGRSSKDLAYSTSEVLKDMKTAAGSQWGFKWKYGKRYRKKWRKKLPYYTVATWQPVVIQKIPNVPHKLGDVAKELSRQRAEGAARVILVLTVEWKRREAKGRRTAKCKGSRTWKWKLLLILSLYSANDANIRHCFWATIKSKTQFKKKKKGLKMKPREWV